MKKKNKEKIVREKRLLPLIKQEINDFVLSEEAKMTQKNIITIGTSLALFALMLHPQEGFAGHSSTSCGTHNSDLFATGTSGRGGHSSNCGHASSHGSHSSGGWC